MVMRNPPLRHSGAGRNPVDKKIPVQRVNKKILSATRDICFCWIPACAGMTAHPQERKPHV
jgi:hypothetical protein